ncbi:MAG: hypothetical protein WCT20_03105 [Candidatus Babeliales bacterium]|jgi:hypothetical protein
MNNEVKEYNLRQINLIEQKIASYKINQKSLRWLIDDLHALVKQIQEPQTDLIQKFISSWATLEVTYALAVDRPIFSFTDNEKVLINEAITELRNIISTYKTRLTAIEE